MAKFFGKDYYVDFEQITEKCEIQKSTDSEDAEGLVMNVFKYELIKMCLQRVLEEGMDTEDDDPFQFNNMSISFKLALLTLIKNKIILEYEDEE